MAHCAAGEHFGFAAIDAAFSALDPWTQFRSRVTEVVAEHGPDDPLSVTVAVFGSVARGEARLDSDVDLVVVQVYLTTLGRCAIGQDHTQAENLIATVQPDGRAVDALDVHLS